MHEQRVEGRPLKGWRGVALIIGVAALVVAASNILYFAERWIGRAASVLFIAFGCAVAWFLLDWYVMSFVYTCENGCLRVTRRYGRYKRPVADVWLNGIKSAGALDDLRRRFPSAKVQRAVKKECPLDPL